VVTAIVIDLLRALGAAHGRRNADGHPAPVFHRDVTPANVLVSVGGHVKLTDFGMARAMDRATVTAPGVLKGKMPYMAPEYIGGAEATPKTDLWSAGAILWEALALRRVRDHSDPVKIYGMASKPATPIRELRPDIPEALAEVVMRSLAISPAERFGSAQEMLQALTAVLRAEEEPPDEAALAAAVRDACSWLDARSAGSARAR
jgi:serine/threonine-protein kinase